MTPARLEAALKAWASADGAGAAAGAEELGRLYGEYRKLLRADRAHRPRAACGAGAGRAAARARRCGAATPVLMYGFDDFGALQLDAIETLGARRGRAR